MASKRVSKGIFSPIVLDSSFSRYKSSSDVAREGLFSWTIVRVIKSV